jgi:hypothetical protein
VQERLTNARRSNGAARKAEESSRFIQRDKWLNALSTMNSHIKNTTAAPIEQPAYSSKRCRISLSKSFRSCRQASNQHRDDARLGWRLHKA